ncbi:MAG: hypothetical protein Q4D95_01515 [Peptoniphilus sp.]|nr:hypothetical protein [Peptoniphilus sp.]
MNRLKKTLTLFYFLLIFFGLGYFYMYLINTSPEYPLLKEELGTVVLSLISVFLFFGAIILQVILHEMGHLIIALLSGYDFVMFRIGSIALVKTDEGFKFGKFNIPGTGGQALLCPKGKAYDRYKYKLYMYGGVIANIVVAVLCFLILLSVEGLFLQIFLFFMTALGILFSLMNGIPLSEQIVNDAMNAKLMDKHEEYRVFIKYTLKLSKSYVNSKGLKDLDEDELKYLLETKAEFAELDLLKGDYYGEIGDFERAERAYKKALEKSFLSGEIQRLSVVNELIYLLVLKGDEEFKKYYTFSFRNSLTKVLSKMISGFHTRYAVAKLQDEDYKSAEKIKEQFNKYKKGYIFKAQVADVERKLQFVDARAGEPR